MDNVARHSLARRNAQQLIALRLHITIIVSDAVLLDPLHVELLDAVDKLHSITAAAKQLKVSYAFQAKVRPPTIVLRVNSEKLLHFSYQRYIENRFREAFGLKATPIEIQLRKK